MTSPSRESRNYCTFPDWTGQERPVGRGEKRRGGKKKEPARRAAFPHPQRFDHSLTPPAVSPAHVTVPDTWGRRTRGAHPVATRGMRRAGALRSPARRPPLESPRRLQVGPVWGYDPVPLDTPALLSFTGGSFAGELLPACLCGLCFGGESKTYGARWLRVVRRSVLLPAVKQAASKPGESIHFSPFFDYTFEI